jgi:hypothetical protein
LTDFSGLLTGLLILLNRLGGLLTGLLRLLSRLELYVGWTEWNDDWFDQWTARSLTYLLPKNQSFSILFAILL